MSLVDGPHGYRVDPDLGIVYGRRGRPIGSPDSSGYLQIDGRSRGLGMISVARYIWEAVNGPIPEGMEVNHKNGVHDDNRIANFEIVTHQGNVRHAYATGLKNNRGENHPSHKLTEADVIKMRRLASTRSPRQLGEEFGISRRHAAAVISGKFWPHVPMEAAS